MKKKIEILFMVSIDTTLLIFLFYLSVYLRSSLHTGYIPIFNQILLKDFLFVIFVVITLFYHENIYIHRYDFWQETKKIFKSLFLAYLIVFTVLTLMKTSLDYSRLFITFYFALALFLLPLFKKLVKTFMYKYKFYRDKVFLVGNKEQIKKMKEEFFNNKYIGIECNKDAYDMVIVASKGMTVEEINTIILKYLNENISLYVVPFITSINFATSNIMEYTNIRYSTIQIENRLLLVSNLWIKGLFEFFLTLIGIPFFLVIHIFLLMAIKIDSKGSILFKQTRLGKNNKNFICYKYRTMYENSNELLEVYLRKHPEEKKHYETYHKYQNDPRITKVGKFLRATSLDELAQIMNVLRGEMSLVGPRPYMENESVKLGNKKEFILKVKPGITGLWQVSGRNNLTFQERGELEIWYIKNWSLWADFVILMKTFKVVIGKVGAK